MKGVSTRKSRPLRERRGSIHGREWFIAKATPEREVYGRCDDSLLSYVCEMGADETAKGWVNP